MIPLEVAVYIRPWKASEQTQGFESFFLNVNIPEKSIRIMNPTGSTTLRFDRIYDFRLVLDEHAEDRMHQKQSQDILDDVWRGFNTSTILHGPQNTGKTVFLLGRDVQQPGLIDTFCSTLFNRIKQQGGSMPNVNTRVCSVFLICEWCWLQLHWCRELVIRLKLIPVRD